MLSVSLSNSVGTWPHRSAQSSHRQTGLHDCSLPLCNSTRVTWLSSSFSGQEGTHTSIHLSSVRSSSRQIVPTLTSWIIGRSQLYINIYMTFQLPSFRIQFRLHASIATVPSPDGLHNSIYGSMQMSIAGFNQNNIIPLGINRSSTEVVYLGPISHLKSIPFSGKENRTLVSRSTTHSGRQGGRIKHESFMFVHYYGLCSWW